MIDPLDELLGYQLRRASAVMMADLTRTLGSLELRATEASVVLAISTNPGATQSEIGRLLGIQRANMAPIVAMLMARDLIDRSASDGRSHQLSLSHEGAGLASQVADAIARHEARFLPDLGMRERGLLLEQLRAVRARDHVDRK
ncbi:MAG TPA: MarR family transcriptional regulator [Sphingomonas sp.]|jgi:DNA-binding MarR family transcriptional regulator